MSHRDAPVDWVAWHRAYDDPDSGLSARLRAVMGELDAAVTETPPGPCRVLSLCAGDGRDVMGVLARHPRAHEVTAVLVELDDGLADAARRAAAGLPGDVEVRTADAGDTAHYLDVLPVDVLVLCGIFGNIDGDDRRRTVAAAAGMVRAGGSVIWTRHARPPDRTGELRSSFGDAGFEELAFVRVPGTVACVGRHRLRAPASLPHGVLFRFRGDGHGAA